MPMIARRPLALALLVTTGCREPGDAAEGTTTSGGGDTGTLGTTTATTTGTSTASTATSADPDDSGGSSSDDGPIEPPTVCSASTPCFYVTETGAGTLDGSSWTNAMPGLPYDEVHPYLDLPRARLTRGATYLLADGSYPGYVLDDQGGGEELITLRKATAADHGDDDGWDDAMGDGEAVFESAGIVIAFSPGAKHYLLDGRRGEGKSPGEYGFRFYSTASRTEGAYMVNIDATGAYDQVGDVWDITLRHIDFDWDNGTPAGPCGLSAAVQVHGPLPNGDWTIADSYIHHCGGGAAYLRSGSGFVFDNNYIYLMGDETGPGVCPEYGEHGHWETFWVTISTGLELTRNTFENAYGAGQTGWVMLEATDVLIENNLFFCSDPAACDVGGNGIIGAWSSSANHDVLITHNTFRDLFNGAHYLFEDGTNIVITDNVYENAPGLADPE